MSGCEVIKGAGQIRRMCHGVKKLYCNTKERVVVVAIVILGIFLALLLFWLLFLIYRQYWVCIIGTIEEGWN